MVLWLGHAGKGLSREDRCLPWSGLERELEAGDRLETREETYQFKAPHVEDCCL